jgi:hypothetical protein
VGALSTIRFAGGAVVGGAVVVAGLAVSALAAPAAQAAHAAAGQPTARIRVRHIPVGGVQFQVAIDPVRHLAWAATANGLVRISERTQRVTGRFKVSAEYVTVDPRTATVWGAAVSRSDGRARPATVLNRALSPPRTPAFMITEPAQ